MLKPGRTYWPNGDSGECYIRNLSESGAQLEVRGPVPSTFDLVIGCDQFRRSCCVVWRNMGQIGVKFVQPHEGPHESQVTISSVAEFRQYTDICRALARNVDAATREMLLKMAAAWESHARRPRRKMNAW